MKYLIILIIYTTGFSQTSEWKVVWDKNPEKDIKEYIVYKGDKELARVKSPDTFYVDMEIKPGTLYTYRIKAVNKINIPSLFSDPAKAAIPGFENMPDILGISKNNSFSLNLKEHIKDPDDSAHEIKRISIPPDSKISVSLDAGYLIFKANENWTDQDTENVEIEVKDSHEFFNIATITIKDESVVEEFVDTTPTELDIKIFPSEFSLNRFSKITLSNIPENSNISIYDSFGTLVYSEKDISDKFTWDAEDNNGDQVLFGLYNFILYNKMNKSLFEGSFRVIP
jgi:CHU domain-containing protein